MEKISRRIVERNMIVGRRIGVIDIGSNSVRLLVADVSSTGIRDICKGLNTTRLYENISDDYMLDNESMDRTVMAIHEYVNIADRKSSDEIYMFATAAVRVAKNKKDFIRKVREKTKIILEVVSEEREAMMAFAGIDSDSLCGVIDIGGASTEIALGNEGKIIESSSAKVGAVKCKEILRNDKDTDAAVSFIESVLLEESKNTIDYIKGKKDIKFYGVGGTITTMAAMLKGLIEYNSEIIDETVISYDELKSMITKLKAMDINERKQLAGLQPKRADIIVYGLLILETIMKHCNISCVQASDKGNLAGYIQLLINEIV